MNAVTIIFAVVFTLLGIYGIGLFCMNAVYLKRRAELKTTPKEEEISAEELTVRIRGAFPEICLTPENVPKEEERPVIPSSAEEGAFIPLTPKRSFHERYEELDGGQKKLLEEFVAYVCAKEHCEKQLRLNALTVKYKKSCVVRAVIRRGRALLQFSVLDPDFGRLVREKKTGGLKVKPVELRLDSQGALETAKRTADITMEYLIGEENFRREQRRAARPEKITVAE